MLRRWKVLTAACVAAMAMSGGTAMAHPPEELGGTALTDPWGWNFSYFANFQTSPDQNNPANPHATSSDIAFSGDLAYVGDYGGFRIFDISEPTPTLVSDVRCYGPQADPSVFDTDADGEADTLVLSVDSVLTGTQCGALPARKVNGQYPAGSWEGLRVFDISDPTAPAQIATVYQDCGSHTNTLLPAPDGDSMYVLNSSYPLGDGPTCGPPGEAQGRKVNHGVVQVVEVPFDDPSEASELTELPIVYPGDEDGTYKPVSEHGIGNPALLDNFLGCHDLSVFPGKGMVGAACGEQAQVWDIDRTTGLPDTEDPRWVHDQKNVDFWHSATFSWDGKVANFIDESFGDGCPAVTTKTGQDSDATQVFETGNMFFFDTKSGELLSEYRNPRRTNDDLGAGTRLTYCSSHLGIPVPARDRYLLVNAYYRGGSSVIDFGDPTAPEEIAFADLKGTNTWSAYTYPRRNGRQSSIPVYSNDGLSRDYDTSAAFDYRETAYGFMRFRADVGRINLVGFDHLNPQLQERVIPTNIKWRDRGGKPRTHAQGRPAPEGARNRSARPFDK